MNYPEFTQVLARPVEKEDIPMLIKGVVFGYTINRLENGFLAGSKEQRQELLTLLMPILLFGEARPQEMTDELMDTICQAFGQLKWIAREVLDDIQSGKIEWEDEIVGGCDNED